MQTTTRIRLAATAAAALGVFAPLAQAGVADGRSPDTRDAAAMAHGGALYTDTSYATAVHARDLGESSSPAPADGRSPDTMDAAAAAAGLRVDGRSPDTRDAAAAPTTVVVAAPVASFDWTDAGIGAAGGFGIALVLAGAYALARAARRDELAV